jgi:hypothetical protein
MPGRSSELLRSQQGVDEIDEQTERGRSCKPVQPAHRRTPSLSQPITMPNMAMTMTAAPAKKMKSMDPLEVVSRKRSLGIRASNRYRDPIDRHQDLIKMRRLTCLAEGGRVDRGTAAPLPRSAKPSLRSPPASPGTQGPRSRRSRCWPTHPSSPRPGCGRCARC